MALALMLNIGVASVAFAEDTCRILAFGDSLTAGYGVDEHEAFPAQLENWLRERGWPCGVVNAGVSGDTSSAGLGRIAWSLADGPTHVIVELGANDGLRGLPVTNLEQNLTGIVEQVQGAGIPVMLTGMVAPANFGAAYQEDFAAVFPTVAEATGAAFYPFFLDGVVEDRSLHQEDGLHPNPRGVAVIVERIGPEIIRWLEATGLSQTG